MSAPADTLTFLFTDIEGSSRLWEQVPERMGAALARHDAILREAVQTHHGRVVKMLGDGVNAVFDDPLDGVEAILQIQLALADAQSTAGLPLKVRSALHAGVVEARDRDFFGSPVNRAARLMSSAHGGQVLLSQAVVQLLADRLPAGVELRDLGSARLRDLATPEREYQLVHGGLRSDFPALRSLASTPNNLTLQLTSLVGREREIAQIREALSKSRLVTLVGPGGIGKTRIARQVAAESIGAFPDGVWFVDLAPISDAQHVASALSSVLSLAETAERPLLDSIVEHLATHRALIVLDNCEHVMTPCVQLARRVLEKAASVCILATSREALRVAGETTHIVPALSSPGASRKVRVGELQAYDAARLFIERATAAAPAFSANDANAAHIADICRRLDGIPLAIELAAARVRALSVERIVQGLEDRFRLLVGGDRSALPRQQTLRALIDWSYETLSEAERTLLRRLAIFAGGWTLDAAEAIVAFGDIAADEVVDVQTALVEKSLITVDADRERYGMLETVRAYARERLAESGEQPQVAERHLAHYLALAEASRDGLAGAQRAQWIARLDNERDNLLGAHRECDAATDGGTRGLRLVAMLDEYFYARAAPTILAGIINEALHRPEATRPTKERARALFVLGQVCCFTGRYADAQAPLKECIEIAREVGDERRIAEALQPLAMAAFGLGDTAAARGYLEEACALAREAGDQRELAAGLNGLVQVLRMDALYEKARPLCEEVVALARAIGNPEVLAVGLINVAAIELAQRHDDRAKPVIRDMLANVGRTASTPILQSALDVAAVLACHESAWPRAARYFAIVERSRGETGLNRDPADEAFVRTYIERSRVASPDSTSSSNGEMELDQAIAEARAWLEGPS
jgi:predicted ATPase/class 3 adenylate cyclase